MTKLPPKRKFVGLGKSVISPEKKAKGLMGKVALVKFTSKSLKLSLYDVSRFELMDIVVVNKSNFKVVPGVDRIFVQFNTETIYEKA